MLHSDPKNEIKVLGSGCKFLENANVIDYTFEKEYDILESIFISEHIEKLSEAEALADNSGNVLTDPWGLKGYYKYRSGSLDSKDDE